MRPMFAALFFCSALLKYLPREGEVGDSWDTDGVISYTRNVVFGHVVTANCLMNT